MSSMSVTPTTKGTTLLNKLVTNQSGFSAISASYDLGDASQIGTYTGFSSPPIVITDGVVLSTGHVVDTVVPPTPNLPPSTSFGGGSTPEIDTYAVKGKVQNWSSSHDTAKLTMHFTLANPEAVAFSFVIGSVEYPDYVSNYTDAFFAFLDGTQITFDSQSLPIQIGTSFSTALTTADTNSIFAKPYGLIGVLATTSGNLAPGNHTISFEIADTNDSLLDSAVFLTDFHTTVNQNGPFTTSLPTLAIMSLNSDQSEGNSGSTPFTFTVTRSGNTTIVGSANWVVSGSGANPANAADFTGGVLPSGTISFAAGETVKTITVNVAGDTTVEPDEGFTVSLVSLNTPATSTVIGTAAATGVILNDDASTTLSIAASSANKAEGNSGSTPFTFTVTRSGNTTIVGSANWVVSGSGANPANAADFTGGVLPSGTISFAAGETVKTITVNVAGDTTVEPDEGFTVSLVSLNTPATSTVIGTAAATGVILNDDASTTLSIAASSANKAEGNSGSTPFTFTVTRSGNTTIVGSANWVVSGSGANPANAADFTGGVLPSGTISFAAGETVKTITVNVAGDTTVEPGEVFVINLNTPAANTVIGTAVATGFILNDDKVSTANVATVNTAQLAFVTPVGADKSSTLSAVALRQTLIGGSETGTVAELIANPTNMFNIRNLIDFTDRIFDNAKPFAYNDLSIIGTLTIPNAMRMGTQGVTVITDIGQSII